MGKWKSKTLSNDPLNVILHFSRVHFEIQVVKISFNGNALHRK
jgi:hypothetical protein